MRGFCRGRGRGRGWAWSWGWPCARICGGESPASVMTVPSSPQPQVAHMVSSLPSRGSSSRGRRGLQRRRFRRGTTGSSRPIRSSAHSCGTAPLRDAYRPRGGAVGDGALGGELEAERHRIGDNRAQRTDFQLDAVHSPTGGVFAHRIDNTLRQRHLVHVCPNLGRVFPTIGAVGRESDEQSKISAHGQALSPLARSR